MAERHTIAALPGGLAAALWVAAAVAAGLLPLLALAFQAGGPTLDGAVWAALRFTLVQAGLSTLLSVVPAVPLARALARRQFTGRGLLLRLLAVPLALPAIVAVLAVVSVYGANGVLGGLMPVYGLPGILLTHVFFNLPLATRLVLEALATTPPEAHRLAAQLGFSDNDVLRHVDGPVLRARLPAIAGLVFLLCAASFVTVLTLGGGPAATTLEVAIYQALRMDFDPARAAGLSLLQLALSLTLVALAGRMMLAQAPQAPLRLRQQRFDGHSPAAKALDAVMLVLAAAVVAPPVVALVAAGLSHVALSAALFSALGWSLAIGGVAALFATVLGYGLAGAAARLPQRRMWFEGVALAGVMVPPAVMATGWFLIFGRNGTARAELFLLVVALNALMALPFVVAVLAPQLARLAAAHDRLCASLGISGWARLRLIDLPALRRPLAQALLLAGIMAMGDLTAITLFGSGGILTLPALVYQQMGHYRGNLAAGTALVLAVVIFLAAWLAERLGAEDDPH